MYPWFLHRGGGYTLVAVAAALLALTTVLGVEQVLVPASLACLALAAIRHLVGRRRERGGDVNVLVAAERFRRRSAQESETEDPLEESDQDAGIPAPYCHHCDEGYARGVERCLLCRRRLT